MSEPSDKQEVRDTRPSTEGRIALFAIIFFTALCAGWFVWMTFFAGSTLERGLDEQLRAGNPDQVLDRLAPLTEDGQLSEGLALRFQKADAYQRAITYWRDGAFQAAHKTMSTGFEDAKEIGGKPAAFARRLETLDRIQYLSRLANGSEDPEAALDIDKEGLAALKKAKETLDDVNESELMYLRSLARTLKSRNPTAATEIQAFWPALLK